MKESEVPNYIGLVDDGTLDTVIECFACEEQFRFNFDGEGEQEYDAFVEECILKVNEEHECDDD